MKKVLALTMGLLFAANTGFAAADQSGSVPAKHWSYEAVALLIHEGIIDGADKPMVSNDKTMTR